MPRVKLTAQFVEKVRPPDRGRVEYFDMVLPSFGLRVSHTGAKSWNVFYWLRRRQRRMTLGRYPVLSLAEAREEARKALQRVAAGVDPTEERKQLTPENANTFAVVADEFIWKYAKPNTRSWPETMRILDKDVLPLWGNRPIAEISRIDVLSLIDAIVARHAPVMANYVLAVVRKLFNWAIERGYIETSPAAGVRAPTSPRSRDRVLSDDELLAVWLACEQIGYPFGPLVQLLITTAQRRGEVAGSRWDEIDLVNGVWTIPGERVKSGRTQTVPLTDLSLTLLKEVPLLNSSPYLFTTRGDTPVSGFSKAKQQLDEASGVTDWRIHDLRRTAASGLAMLGTPTPVISKVLNHSSGAAYGGVTAIYNRYAYEDEKRAALEQWCEHISGLMATIQN